jgi:UDP-N-acetyl-D-mannosaminuronate dehydrogenase
MEKCSFPSGEANDKERNFCNGANLLMLGITFKENCPDVRNTKIVDVIESLTDYGISVTTYDP